MKTEGSKETVQTFLTMITKRKWFPEWLGSTTVQKLLENWKKSAKLKENVHCTITESKLFLLKVHNVPWKILFTVISKATATISFKFWFTLSQLWLFEKKMFGRLDTKVCQKVIFLSIFCSKPLGKYKKPNFRIWDRVPSVSTINFSGRVRATVHTKSFCNCCINFRKTAVIN